MSAWHGLGDFVRMGGYAVYVWGTVGVTAALLAAEVWHVRWRARRLRDDDGGSRP